MKLRVKTRALQPLTVFLIAALLSGCEPSGQQLERDWDRVIKPMVDDAFATERNWYAAGTQLAAQFSAYAGILAAGDTPSVSDPILAEAKQRMMEGLLLTERLSADAKRAQEMTSRATSKWAGTSKQRLELLREKILQYQSQAAPTPPPGALQAAPYSVAANDLFAAIGYLEASEKAIMSNLVPHLNTQTWAQPLFQARFANVEIGWRAASAVMAALEGYAKTDRGKKAWRLVNDYATKRDEAARDFIRATESGSLEVFGSSVDKVAEANRLLDWETLRKELR